MHSEKDMRMTRYESVWLRTFRTLVFIVPAIFFILPLFTSPHREQEPLADAASLRQLLGGRFMPQPSQEEHGEFHGISVTPPRLSDLLPATSVLGITYTSQPYDYNQGKRIEIDLTRQKAYAFEGNDLVYAFTISSGKWYPTPTGEFTIWAKVRSQKMSGGDKSIGTYYYLPNVPYVMFFSNKEIAKMRGFSFHGTYWHDNFGSPMSHGCVNMRIEDAKILYDWANPPVTDLKAWSTLASSDSPGTPVIIYGETPRE